MGTDLRKYPRIKTVLDIEYSNKHSSAIELKEELYCSYGAVTDLSRAGANMLVDEPLIPDQHIHIKGIGQDNGPIECIVKWSLKNHGKKYRVGVEFAQLAEL